MVGRVGREVTVDRVGQVEIGQRITRWPPVAWMFFITLTGSFGSGAGGPPRFWTSSLSSVLPTTRTTPFPSAGIFSSSCTRFWSSSRSPVSAVTFSSASSARFCRSPPARSCRRRRSARGAERDERVVRGLELLDVGLGVARAGLREIALGRERERVARRAA
jgi:hypothetical protein